MKPNLEVKAVRGDGNCLFRSLAYLAGDEDSHGLVRTTLVAEVRHNPSEYQSFVSKDIKEWCSDMLGGAWGDGICLRAGAKQLETSIAVFRKGSDQDPTVFIPQGWTGQMMCLELDETSGVGTEHYNPMEKLKKLKKKKAKKSKKATLLAIENPKMKTGKKGMKVKKIKDKKMPVDDRLEVCDKDIEMPLKDPEAKSLPPSDLEVQVCKPVEAGGICRKCGRPVERSKAKVCGKKADVWICKVCHSKSSSLYQIYGKWPPARFAQLSKPAQEKFWQDVADKTGKDAIRKYVDETISVSKVDQTGNRVSGKYLPLSVYKRLGYNAKRIKALCHDTQEDPIFGTCYKVAVHSSFDVSMEEHKREQKTGAYDGADALPPPYVAFIRNGKSGKEDKKLAAEKIRVAKAVATQQARDNKASQKVARSWMSKFVKLSFNLNAILKDKFVKKFCEEAKEDCNAAKPQVEAMTKQLEKAMGGQAVELDPEACKKLYDTASDAHQRLLTYQTMKSRVL